MSYVLFISVLLLIHVVPDTSRHLPVEIEAAFQDRKNAYHLRICFISFSNIGASWSPWISYICDETSQTISSSGGTDLSRSVWQCYLSLWPWLLCTAQASEDYWGSTCCDRYSSCVWTYGTGVYVKSCNVCFLTQDYCSFNSYTSLRIVQFRTVVLDNW